MNTQELTAILESHAKWLRGEAGTRANLARANLARADLADANLAGANLVRADLADANLADANLADANLADADLYGANLRGIRLGYESTIARRLCLLGACKKAKQWVDAQSVSDVDVLAPLAEVEWVEWLKNVLGGPVTHERFMTVTDFRLAGVVGWSETGV